MLSVGEGTRLGPGCFRQKETALLACPVGTAANALGCHSQRSLLFHSLCQQGKKVQRQRGNHYVTPSSPPPPTFFCFLLWEHHQVRVETCLWCLLSAKADSSDFIFRDARFTKFINASLLPVSHVAWPPELSQIAQINLAASSCPGSASPPPPVVAPSEFPLGLQQHKARLLISVPC